MCPARESDFAYGKPHIRWKAYLDEHLGADHTKKYFTSHAYDLSTTFYNEIWKAYTETLADRKLHFNDQCQQQWGLSQAEVNERLSTRRRNGRQHPS